MDRDEILEEYKWDLSSIYQNKKSWEEDIKEVDILGDKLEKYKDKVSEENIFEVINFSLEISSKLENIYVYSKLLYDENTKDPKRQSMVDKAEYINVKISEKIAFIEPNIMKLDIKKIRGIDKLKEYSKYIEDMFRQKKHILSKEEENILASMGEVFSSSENTFGLLNEADLEFGNIENEEKELVRLTHGNYIKFLESHDRKVREASFKRVYGTYEKLKNTFSGLLKNHMKKNTVVSRIRKYDSPIEMFLDGNKISPKVYESLIEVVGENLEYLHKYIDKRKDILGLEDLHMYDLYVPLVKDIDKTIGYDEAREILMKGLEPLGEEYLSIVRKGLDSKWVDVYESDGKRSGAYSWGTYSSKPYILLNYHDRIDDVFTLAHEMGHSIHSYYTRNAQPYVYGDYSIFLAEIASTVNEILLINYLLENSKDESEKRYLLNYYIEQFRGTVYRQTMFAEFERDIYELISKGEDVNVEVLKKTYIGLNKKYFGENIIIDEEIEMEWARIPHFYYNFYVYQYATGFSIASYFAGKILEGDISTRDNYIKFLKSGSSDYPTYILKNIGVDVEDKKVYQESLKTFKKLIEKL